LNAPAKPRTRTSILIGGAEDKTGERLILAEVARRASHGRIVVATLASQEPLRQWDTYRSIFADLGVAETAHLAIDSREDALDPARMQLLDDARCVFFTGGDQVKLSMKLSGTLLHDRIRDEYYDAGLLLAGTSAGASAMGETMLVANEETDRSHKIKGAFYMARGLGLLRDVVIDQHFGQRARIERLVGAVAENPGALGIGIDEDTAVILEAGERFRVIGSGAVYVADGRDLTYTNVAEQAANRTLSVFDVKLHVLSHGNAFDMKTRRPGKDDGARAS